MNAVLSVGLAVRLVSFGARLGAPRPRVGHYLVPTGPRSKAAYLIRAIRPSRSARYPFRIRCERVVRASIPSDAIVHAWVWDKRVRSRAPLRSPLL